jgi:hypothetical protein
MISRKITVLSTAVAAVALVATLALARTVHTPMASAEHASAPQGKVIGTVPGQSNGSHLHGIITCGPTTSAQECDRLEMLLPMNVINPGNTATLAVRI